MPKLLKFVDKTHPILREVMPEIRDFKDPELHKLIENMLYSILPAQLKKANAVYKSAAGMAANQWGIRKRIFIFTPEGPESDKQAEATINPSYVPYLRVGETQPKLVSAYEGCFSIPLTLAAVKRYETIMATYYTPAGEKIERLFEEWEARVFQHETDHLDGKLCDSQFDNYPGPVGVERVIFKNMEEMDNFKKEQRS